MTLDPEDIAAIAEAVAGKLGKLTPAQATNAEDIITSAEVMELLRLPSATSLCRMMKRLKVKRLGQNRYRRGDIENAVARATMTPRGSR